METVSPLRDWNFLLAIVVAGVVLAAFPSCVATRSVAAHADPQVDYSRYRTFAVIDSPTAAAADPALPREMKAAAVASLTEKGLWLAPLHEADLLVLVHGGRVPEVELKQAGFGYGRFRPWGYGGGAYELGRPRSGVFVVDVIDARTRDLVWRGMAGEPFHAPDFAELHASVQAAAAQFPH